MTKYPEDFLAERFLDEVAHWISLGFDLQGARDMARAHVYGGMAQQTETQKDHDEDKDGRHR